MSRRRRGTTRRGGTQLRGEFLTVSHFADFEEEKSSLHFVNIQF